MVVGGMQRTIDVISRELGSVTQAVSGEGLTAIPARNVFHPWRCAPFIAAYDADTLYFLIMLLGILYSHCPMICVPCIALLQGNLHVLSPFSFGLTRSVLAGATNSGRLHIFT